MCWSTKCHFITILLHLCWFVFGEKCFFSFCVLFICKSVCVRVCVPICVCMSDKRQTPERRSCHRNAEGRGGGIEGPKVERKKHTVREIPSEKAACSLAA